MEKYSPAHCDSSHIISLSVDKTGDDSSQFLTMLGKRSRSDTSVD